ncbi:SLC13 family permease [Pelagicoccus sp. SDUM812003]|uniref:SLC13 family permease n=1 Tax=Pelagicoccus sp. SDUM812003 TaxID=3041267 RepID=UPI00280FAC58|nr:SLC13 family permease [Pelagicoccus sp. SDUM812003]MDQ8205042.1 SLC13 family permease [Pelagicoccus sp. SDUM812003]
MSWEIIVMLALLVAMTVSFVSERIPTELTGMTGFALVLLLGMLSPQDALAVFSNQGPIAIAAMFIISATLEKCGAIRMAASSLQRLPKLPIVALLPILTISVAAISAFINNTAVVVVFLPIVISLARRMELSASKLLIPLSYASIFGGTCTLVGTSTNLLVSSMAREAGREPFGMFELAWVGLPLLMAGMLYLALAAPKLLPDHDLLTDSYADENPREYIVEAFVQSGSPLVGVKVSESTLAEMEHGRVLEIHRHGVPMRRALSQVELKSGDRLLLAVSPQDVPSTQEEEGIDLRGSLGDGLEGITQSQGVIVEGIISPDSKMIGKTLDRVESLERLGLVPLGLNRRERSIRSDLESVTLEQGDTLLLLGTAEAIDELGELDDIIVLDKPSVVMPARRRKLPIIIAVIAGVIASSSMGLMPIAPAGIIGCVVLFLTGCITLKGAYDSIHWPILFLIFSMLGVGAAMESTGTSQLLADGMVSVVSGLVSESWQPFALLVAVYLMTTLLTEILSNNAAAVLLVSLSLGLTESIGVDAKPFLVAISIAASASFATPIGYQTNTYVYSVGGYRFVDFFRIGIWINVIGFVVSMIVIPMVWEF